MLSRIFSQSRIVVYVGIVGGIGVVVECGGVGGGGGGWGWGGGVWTLSKFLRTNALQHLCEEIGGDVPPLHTYSLVSFPGFVPALLLVMANS